MEKLPSVFIRRMLRFTVAALAAVAAVYVYAQTTTPDFRYYYLLPALFAISWLVALYPGIQKYPLFLGTFSLIAFARYVALPVLQTHLNVYDTGRPAIPSSSSYEQAIGLMAYELSVVTVFLCVYLLSRRTGSAEERVEHPLVSVIAPEYMWETHRSHPIYWLFIFTVLCLTLVVPESLRTISFVVPRYEYGYDPDLLESLVGLLIIVAKNLLFLMALERLTRNAATRPTPAILCLAATLANGCIFSGMNRSDFLLALVSSCVVYAIVVGRHTRLMIMVGVPTAVAVSSILTARRDYYSSPESDLLSNVLETVHIYTGGIYNVAMSIEATALNPHFANVGTLLVDLFRPIFGIGIIIKNFELSYSSIIFNETLYGTDHRAQIIPMIGEGYLTLGFVFAPLLDIFFIFIALKLTETIRKTHRIEILFFLTISIIRSGFMMGQNAMILVNDMSYNLFIPLALLFVDNLASKKRSLISDA